RSFSGATGTSAGGRGLTGATQFTFSSKGVMIYVPEADAARTRSVALVDHAGVRTPLNLPPAQYNHPRISRDGQQLVLQTEDGSNSNIRIYDLNGASPMRRLTFAGQNSFPIWTKDGRAIVFSSDREGVIALYRQPADNSSPAERLIAAEQGQFLRAE